MRVPGIFVAADVRRQTNETFPKIRLLTGVLPNSEGVLII
jgi:hypothetical protein